MCQINSSFADQLNYGFGVNSPKSLQYHETACNVPNSSWYGGLRREILIEIKVHSYKKIHLKITFIHLGFRITLIVFKEHHWTSFPWWDELVIDKVTNGLPTSQHFSSTALFNGGATIWMLFNIVLNRVSKVVADKGFYNNNDDISLSVRYRKYPT